MIEVGKTVKMNEKEKN